MTEELKPCPFQGCTDLTYDGKHDTVFCNICRISIYKDLWNRRASPWVRVEDDSPCEEEDVFIFLNNGKSGKARFSSGKYMKCIISIGFNAFCNLDDEEDGIVTHWMPIPEIEND